MQKNHSEAQDQLEGAYPPFNHQSGLAPSRASTSVSPRRSARECRSRGADSLHPGMGRETSCAEQANSTPSSHPCTITDRREAGRLLNKYYNTPPSTLRLPKTPSIEGCLTKERPRKARPSACRFPPRLQRNYSERPSPTARSRPIRRQNIASIANGRRCRQRRQRRLLMARVSG